MPTDTLQIRRDSQRFGNGTRSWGNKAIQDVEWHSGVMNPPQLPHVSLFLLERPHLFQTSTTKKCCRFQSLQNCHRKLTTQIRSGPFDGGESPTAVDLLWWALGAGTGQWGRGAGTLQPRPQDRDLRGSLTSSGQRPFPFRQGEMASVKLRPGTLCTVSSGLRTSSVRIVS